ncbi:MAG TPA: nuclear transport factor 2 family protein [Bradyrhizobium sp.]|jgi:ketosteroid isomerase-like protein|nr:nuclear transport factor 2 family protein [Bradyrhizobium sp.]
MNSQENKQHVIAAWEAFASRDKQRIAAMFSDDAEWLAPKGNATALAVPYTNHMIGREQIAHFIAVEFGKLFCADVKVDFRGFYAENDVVIVEERMRATLSNGHPYDVEYCFIFELKDGLIRRVREYMDTLKGARMVFGSLDRLPV